jgi:cytochrome c
MGDLGWNKIFFSILAAALIILGLREISSLAFSDGHGHHGHGEEEEVDLNTKYARQFAYVIPVEGANGTGPALYGIMGQDIAGVSGFQYSGVLNEKEGDWNYENMNAFLENPGGWAPGTKMTFAGLRKGSDRANVLAFLETISPNAPAMPEPAPEAPAVDEGVEDAAAPAEETPGDAEIGAETGLEEAATPVAPRPRTQRWNWCPMTWRPICRFWKRPTAIWKGPRKAEAPPFSKTKAVTRSHPNR